MATENVKADDDTGVLGIALLVQCVTFVIEPFILRALWFWYLVPLGLPALTWARAFGLNLVVGVLVYRWSGERTNEQTLKAAVETLIAGVIALCIGWFVLKVTS